MAKCYMCRDNFRSADEYRDHLPCGGTTEQQEIRKLRAELEQAQRDLALSRAAWDFLEARARKAEAGERKAFALLHEVVDSWWDGCELPIGLMRRVCDLVGRSR